jgi:diguanylate cyclase (GGDEF)-like protein
VPLDLLPGELQALKKLFFQELETSLQRAREAQDLLLRQPNERLALQELHRFFHRIAGTAPMIDLRLLGHLAAICEESVGLAMDGSLASHRAQRLISAGLAGVRSVYEQNEIPLDDADLAEGGPGLGTLIRSNLEGGAGSRLLAKVLVIDDDPVSLKLMETCLTAAGFACSTCREPQQAMDSIQSELPDLILLDVVMPGLDGFDVCRRVRAHPALQFTPIIFVTRQGEIDQKVRGLEVGGNDYLAKPFQPEELVARVRSQLQRLSTLREMAIRDGLTRCYNHKYFKARLDQEIARCHRYKGQLSLAMLDIDHFKVINDTHGHLTGDTVLAELSGMVLGSVRGTDVVARYGGEEFGILLVQAGPAEASMVIDRVRHQIETHVFSAVGDGSPGDVLKVTVSIGLAQLAEGDSAQVLLQRADGALYQAKKGGRNRVQLAELQ